MSAQVFVDLLVSASRSPATKCLRRKQYLVNSFRPISTGSQPDTARKAVPPPAPGPPGSRIPLHLGLDRNPEHLSAISRIPIPKGERGEKFVPPPLSRPLGIPLPPEAGQNSPIDKRTWTQRKQEFTDYEKAMERRRILARSFLRPYYQEWNRVNHFRGKSFASNDRLFKREKALFFPNMWGQTLSKSGDGPDGGRDTTNVLVGKISVVGVQSGRWAEEQVDTFLSDALNPELQKLIDDNGGLVQRADMNVQGGWVQAMLVKLFKGRIRRRISQDQWGRYFLVKLARDTGRGLTEDVRDAMGFLNSQVGYVYLLDAECRIRWAGSGDAWKGERDSLNAGIRRLLEEAKATKSKPALLRSSLPSRPRLPGSEHESEHESEPYALAAAA